MVVNNTDFLLAASWIDYDGGAQPWMVIPAGQTVISALHMQVGTDTIEIAVAPEAYVLVDGEAPGAAEDGIFALPGGGAIQAGGTNTLVVTWPCGMTGCVRRLSRKCR